MTQQEARAEAREEYLRAQKAALKELKDEALPPAPLVLDEILPAGGSDRYVDVGVVEIPAERIVGTKSAGRTGALSYGFLPLLDVNTEFAAKWISLCAAHLTEGIREPALCYEYLGNFYVQEGNKRISVLRSFGAPRITAEVRRVMPPEGSAEAVAYGEFLEYYKGSQLYEPRYTTPGSYQKLLSALGKDFGQEWNQWERRTFSSYLQYFREAFAAAAPKETGLSWEEGLLLWLELYPFRDIGRLTAGELEDVVRALLPDMEAIADADAVELETQPREASASIGSKLMSFILPGHVHVAFVHPLDTASPWIKGHDMGRIHLEKALGEHVTVRSYFHADSPQEADRLLDLAVEEGAHLVFTTTPQLAHATTRAAIRHRKVRFFNCSVDVPYSSIRSYYARVYEAKFITGAIAGAMADHDHIGYIGSSPIYGVPASINAFALGAQMTNPRAKVDLRWSCLPGNPVSEFISRGYEVISNRDVPTDGHKYGEFGTYGTYFVGKEGVLTPLASPVWLWGSFYEKVVRSVLEGTWEQGAESGKALNYWWGMESGVIDIELSPALPESMRHLANVLRTGLRTGTIDPFARQIIAQDGRVVNGGVHVFTPDELLHMDWLCENVEGHIPEYEEVLPFARNMVRQLGVHRERIPREKEERAL